MSKKLEVPLLRNKLLIAFSGRARHGKDTACQHIMQMRGKDFDVTKHAFADELKREISGRERELCEEFGVVYDENPDMSDPLCPNGKQPALMQYYGTEYRRAQDPWYWVRLLAETLSKQTSKVTLISDVRFLSEAFWIRASGGLLVRVEREGYKDSSRSEHHASETQLDSYKDWDYTIFAREGELSQFKADVLTVFDSIVGNLDVDLDGLSFTLDNFVTSL